MCIAVRISSTRLTTTIDTTITRLPGWYERNWEYLSFSQLDSVLGFYLQTTYQRVSGHQKFTYPARNSLTQTEIQFCYLFNSETNAEQSNIKNEHNNEQHV